ncbi:hypothetical protein CesoFtcFv8_019412 [Champsocephalus esox]|uniref:Uncharacterized protein n=1 Tax=Champsocephalus esox TaxID=159716 RepID=A0AAN8GL47_9TELE|nr:hypothetical protein CesoFtcFv8_019412 [Champsocephalus esox]
MIPKRRFVTHGFESERPKDGGDLHQILPILIGPRSKDQTPHNGGSGFLCSCSSPLDFPPIPPEDSTDH